MNLNEKVDELNTRFQHEYERYLKEKIQPVLNTIFLIIDDHNFRENRRLEIQIAGDEVDLNKQICKDVTEFMTTKCGKFLNFVDHFEDYTIDEEGDYVEEEYRLEITLKQM